MPEDVNPVIKDFRRAMDASIDYVTPYWEKFLTLYEYWHLKKPDVLKKTYSRISLNYFHTMVQEKIPKIRQNVSDENLVSVEGRDPESEMFAEGAENWLRDLLRNRVKYQHNIDSTLQSVMIGGSGFRMPCVSFKMDSDGKYRRYISGRNLDFLSVLPSPGGGVINPFDNDMSQALEWMFVIDWWSEDKIKALAENGTLDKKAVSKMLDTSGDQNFPESQYMDQYDTISGVEFNGRSYYRRSMRDVKNVPQDRRIVHWFKRDKWYIIGQDAFVLRESEPPLGKGIIPLANYLICPDMNNFYGISYLDILQDLINASQMLVNYRMDANLEALHPQTFIDNRILSGRPAEHFRHRPFATHPFPGAQIADIRKAVWHDRGENMPQQAFMDEDRLKAIMQKVAGLMETTSSMGSVVGNKTAGGVRDILSELSGRPFMESVIFEHRGLREECLLYLLAAKKFINGPQYIRNPRSKSEFPWSRIQEGVFENEYDVQTRGTRFMAEQREKFSRLIALYPYWNQSQNWDTVELDRQVAEVADVLPNPEKAMKVNPSALPAQPMQAGGQSRPGGLASSLDMGQGIESGARENTRQQEPVGANAL